MKPKMATVVGFGALALLGLGVGLAIPRVMGASDPKPGAAASDDARQSSASSIPRSEHMFCAIVRKYESKYRQTAASTGNQIQLTRLVVQRSKELLGLAGTLQGDYDGAWWGQITQIDTEQDGTASVSIALPCDTHRTVFLETWNNSLSDMKYHTMLRPGTALYDSVGELQIGQDVGFKAKLFTHDGRIAESSLTEEGSMLAPEFIARFTDIWSR